VSPPVVLAPDSAPRANGPVPMWPYILVCFSWITCILGVLLLARSRWGFDAPASVGFAAASIGVGGAALPFFRTYRRGFLPTERRWFLLGSFLAFWFYDEFIKIGLMVAHKQLSTRGITIAVLATFVDFVLVWIVVTCLDFWASDRPWGPPPNNRWRGP
jgi:hypothetical protein